MQGCVPGARGAEQTQEAAVGWMSEAPSWEEPGAPARTCGLSLVLETFIQQ